MPFLLNLKYSFSKAKNKPQNLKYKLKAIKKMVYNKEEFSRNLNLLVNLAHKLNISIFFTSIQTLSKRFES
jgi:hypothetical protein